MTLSSTDITITFGADLVARLIPENQNTVLADLIVQTTDYIDAVLGARYRLPLPDSPLLKSLALDMIGESLWNGAQTADVPAKIVRKATQARAILAALASGKNTLPCAILKPRVAPIQLLEYE